MKRTNKEDRTSPVRSDHHQENLEHVVERLKHLASARDAEQQAHYRRILDTRDQVLTQAVVAAAQTLLKSSGYVPASRATSKQNNQQAIAMLQDYLSQSSISEIDQHLLALVGTQSLFGLKLEGDQEDDTMRLFPTGTQELDPLIVLRLAKALNRSFDQEALFWRATAEAINLPANEAELVKAAITALLNEVPVSELDDQMGTMVINSVLGG